MSRSVFHPDLALARFLPRSTIGPRLARFVRNRAVRTPRIPEDMLVEEIRTPEVSLRLYRSKAARDPVPALLWIHGGGYVLGSPEQDDRTSLAFARELGIAVAAVRYRLAPDHPAPAALDDVDAGLRWLFGNAEARGIDPARIAIGGASAGGGLAAALALRAHDEREVRPAFQLLVYPMLDDRTVLRTDVDDRSLRLWSPTSNRFGWTAYLGQDPGSPGVPPYAAPARREDLAGLPPAWIGVGTADLFHDEDVEYAHRLREAGVPCDLTVVPGAFHGFDAVFRRAEVVRTFRDAQIRALRAALWP